MGHLPRLHVVIVHNRDFDPAADPALDPTVASRADVENAARDITAALTARGHRVQSYAVPDGDPAVAALEAVRWLEHIHPDLTFNLCESLAGDARLESLLPSLLDAAGLRYTGSGPLALGMALRKDLCKRLLTEARVPTPEGVVVERGADLAALSLPFPLIVKPTREDASVGIHSSSVVRDREALGARVEAIWNELEQAALVERFVDGRELYVSLIGAPPRALPMHEIDFSAMPPELPRIVAYAGKWEPGSPEWRGTQSVRARPIAAETQARCEEVARAAFAALELRDYARVDLRLDASGTPWVIDVNPNCDLSDGAGVSRAASFAGLAYADLIEEVCAAALAREQKERHVHAAAPAARKRASKNAR
jgi:D-alanine-D-alanine ligase